MNFFERYADFIGPSVHARDIKHKDKTQTFHFRELSAGEAEDLFVLDSAKTTKGLRAKIIAACLCDADGNPVIDEKSAMKLPNALSIALQNESLAINAMTDDSKADAGNVH